MKKNTRIIINHVLALLILLGIAVPVLFTTERMDFFERTCCGNEGENEWRGCSGFENRNGL